MKLTTGAELSLAAKLTMLAAATQAVMITALLAIAAATRDASLATRLALFAVPVYVPVVIIYFLTRYITWRITSTITRAYAQLGSGDFGVELPPQTAGADFAAVREAFANMAAALERSVKQLREADLERRRLFADLAHELATPTSTLLGIAHALRKGEGDPARLLGHLEHESARLDRLIADVREVAHLEDPSLAMTFEPCDVGALATRAVERAQVASDGCTLRCVAVAATAEVDPIRVDQVLGNLISNAVRHAARGTVAVTVRAGEGEVVVRVEDSGPGVPDELLAQLGRRLLRVDPSRSRDTGGHGLGLSIVRAIIARHGGALVFERASLGGLAAEVRLPDAQNQVRSRQQ